MTDENPQAGQRVRRRASRSAGPTGADTDAASTVVPDSKPIEKPVEETVARLTLRKDAPPKVEAAASVPAQVYPTLQEQTPVPVTIVPAPRSSRKLVSGIVLASIAALAFAAVSAMLLVDRNNASNADEERAGYVAGARTTALNLTTLHSDTAAADLDKFLAGTTKEFQSQLDGRKDSFISVLGQVGVQTDGEILEAGFEKSDSGCGTSLVAVKAMQKNKDQPEPEERNYRLRITMCDTDGQLLASNVEFVP
ncbi:hypothetical protein [Rhodococcus sp. OK302]|uniref:hypothetical protein n=1 Tax=Rhodococcus sp. OK302 TaxID=1882769 RepID=UPI000B93F317|nr:hypothetical protein [Rhodococcus sp. OK302]OYD68090.1 Mce-associated membrane protein [Rhodococcus sp. OK302]